MSEINQQFKQILKKCISRFHELSKAGVAFEEENYVANTGLLEFMENFEKGPRTISISMKSKGFEFYLRIGNHTSHTWSEFHISSLHQNFRIHLNHLGEIVSEECDITIDASSPIVGKAISTKVWRRTVNVIPIKRIVCAKGHEGRWEFWIVMLDEKICSARIFTDCKP